MSRSQRDKGMRGQRETAAMFRAAMPGTDPHSGAQSRKGGDAPDVVGVPLLWVECKWQKAPRPEAALRQAQEACGDPGLYPVAICKRDRQRPVAVLDAEDFAEIMGLLWRETGRTRRS